jgi:hypothetical protein
MITGTSALILERDIVIKEQKAEIERLKALCARAAEALSVFNEVYPQQNRSELIVELRKAAE